MSNTKPLILYDRSRVTTDWSCPRKRYWNFEHEGKGITADRHALELFLGTVLHDGLAAIAANTIPIDEIALAAHDEVIMGLPDDEQFANEQAALVEGLLRGFSRHIWPRFSAQYTVVAVEKELLFPHDGMGFMSKPDLLVRDKEGNLWYVEYKSTSTNKEQWVNSWTTAIQLHSSIRAVEHELGEKVTGIIVQGLYKGYVSYGKQTSPFCYGYYKPGNPPFSTDQWRYTWDRGFNKYPVWQKAGGLKAWVDNMPDDLLQEQFPQVPPIFINERLIDAFFRQRGDREIEIRLARQGLMNPDNDPSVKQTLLDMAFPQRWDQCAPSFGKPCQFRKLCHSGMDADPLSAGFVYREPHHTPEMEQWQNTSASTTGNS